MGKTYVWQDIFSIPQFHGGCKLLAVNSIYVYAAAADDLSNIARVTVLFIAVMVCCYIHGYDLRVVGHLLDSKISGRL